MFRLLNMWRAALDRRWISGGLATLICLLGVAYYAKFVHKIYPIDLWLFWTLAKLWWWVAVLNVACLCIGHRIFERFIRIELTALETLVHSMAMGLMAFIVSMYVAGALALYGPVWAVALPALFLVLGGASGLRLARRVWQWLREPRPTSLWVWLVSGLGACCVGLAYLGLLSPDAINYDAAWYHQVIPQDFARAGRIFKHLGNYNMGVPHGATMIHTWGYTVPGLA
ncbi:MAG TPA: hypothetical protein VN764_08470, partial [Polyangiaceae bacterium]|nr:hypothetical protein [Polyangiaceae bacterium]